MQRKILLSAALAALAGCTMAPKYVRPAAPVAETIPYAAEGESPAQLFAWRDIFADAQLRSLIEQAIENNRDLRVATLNVERARALYRVQRSDLLPNVTAGADYFRQRIGENASTGTAGAPGAPPGGAFTFEQYSASAGVSAYELDLFGRVRSLNRQALETYFATEEAQKAATVALIAEVANAYLQLAADRDLLAIAQDTYRSQQESLELTMQLVENGIGNDLDVQRARTSIERARADAAILDAQVGRDANALRLLVGAVETPYLAEQRSIDDIAIEREIPAGLRSELLLERPDVLAAEHRLIGANANIGAARAAFFPRILLTAEAGVASAELSDLFSGGTGVWSFAPSVQLPIFTGGRNRAQLKGAKVDREIAQAEYEGAIQTAFREVADALATRRTIGERIEATENLAEAAARTFALADARFRGGVDNYLAVLDAQREDYSARRELVAARLAEAANLIEIYRSLGAEDDKRR